MLRESSLHFLCANVSSDYGKRRERERKRVRRMERGRESDREMKRGAETEREENDQHREWVRVRRKGSEGGKDKEVGGNGKGRGIGESDKVREKGKERKRRYGHVSRNLLIPRTGA